MSVQSICARLDEIKTRLENEYPRELAQQGCENANAAFANNIAVLKDKSFLISGTTAMFAEFGTGTETDVSHEFAGDMPFEVQPGSWSENDAVGGKHTWSKWNKAGKPGKYRYDNAPKRGMYHGMKYMGEHYEEIAGDVLNG